MTQFIAGSIVTLLIAGVVAAIATLIRNHKEAQPKSLFTPDEKAYSLKHHRNTTFTFDENVKGKIKDFVVQYIDVHGTRYHSIEEAIKSKTLSTSIIEEMELLELELAELRDDIHEDVRYYRIEQTAFDGDIYVYQPCKIKIDTAERMEKDLPARLAIEITQEEDMSLGITKVYVSKNDVTVPSGRYEFDMDNENEEKSFKLLIAGEAEYKAEVAFITDVIGRLDTYNRLIDEGRLTVKENGAISISPPTPEQIEQMRGQAKEAPAKPKSDKEVVQEAKQQIEEEFVSSSSVK